MLIPPLDLASNKEFSVSLRSFSPELTMVYIKSVLIGVLTGATAMVISTIFWVSVAAYQIRGQFPHGEIAFDLRSMLGRPSLVWLATVAGFCAGFYWRYRRGSL